MGTAQPVTPEKTSYRWTLTPTEQQKKSRGHYAKEFHTPKRTYLSGHSSIGQQSSPQYFVFVCSSSARAIAILAFASAASRASFLNLLDARCCLLPGFASRVVRFCRRLRCCCCSRSTSSALSSRLCACFCSCLAFVQGWRRRPNCTTDCAARMPVSNLNTWFRIQRTATSGGGRSESVTFAHPKHSLGVYS